MLELKCCNKKINFEKMVQDVFYKCIEQDIGITLNEIEDAILEDLYVNCLFCNTKLCEDCLDNCKKCFKIEQVKTLKKIFNEKICVLEKSYYDKILNYL